MPEPSDNETTVVLVTGERTEVVLGRVCTRTPDLAMVGVIARVHLLARRRGWTVVLRDPSDELRGLLELVGLGEVLAVEPRREPELGEQLGEDEVVQPRDLPA